VHLRASDFQTAILPPASGADSGADGELNLQAEKVEKPATDDGHHVNRDHVNRDHVNRDHVDRDHGPEAHQERRE
jgi:hypothetical protein